MRHLFRTLPLAFALIAISASANAGDTLLIERVQEVPANAPVRGMRMSEVEAKYGAPTERLDPRGGEKAAWPTINRWVYPAFTVYFEHKRVIDVVVNHASANETGPKPAVK